MIDASTLHRDRLSLCEASPEGVARARAALASLKSTGNRNGIAELVREQRPWVDVDLRDVVPTPERSYSELSHVVRVACLAPGALDFGPGSWFHLAKQLELGGERLEPEVDTLWYEWATTPLPELDDYVIPAARLVEVVEGLAFETINTRADLVRHIAGELENEGVPEGTARDRADAVAVSVLPGWKRAFERARRDVLAVARVIAADDGLVLYWTSRL